MANTAIAQKGNGLGSTTTVLVSDAAVADQAALDAVSLALQAAGHTVAGIDGAHGGVMHFAVQGPDASAWSAEVMGQALSAVCTF
jgi:hypothetical protein